MELEVGQKFVRENNPELGVGIITGIEGRFVDVLFPESGTQMRLTKEAPGLRLITLNVGDEVEFRGEASTITHILAGVATLEDGRVASLNDIWPVFKPPSIIDRLLTGEVSPHDEVANRLDGYKLLNYRRRGAVPSLMGGRVEIFPHQLDTAARAIEADRVRWLLADEVGLGKTVVACMIASGLIRMGRISSAVIFAPETLTVQWLGELYRKFHQVFVHVDAERIAAVRTDFGPEVNPFDVHPFAIVSFDLLAKNPLLEAALNEALPELVIVDEAHRGVDARLEDILFPLVKSAEHALMLTATPFQHDEAGFFRLADALELPHEQSESGHAFSNVSAVTRDDIQTLGTRVPKPIPLEGVDLKSHDLDESDPRVAWLIEQAKAWKAAGEKALVFVNNAARAKRLQEVLERHLQTRVFMFHEQMKTSSRDIELAQFRISQNPVLVSSGAGSEGRNFQFCQQMLHFDLPDDPMVLEQRIGRLDRIGRTGEIPIYYFVTGAGQVEEFERLGIFERATMSAKHRDGWSFPDSHSQENSSRTIAQIPSDLDELTEKFCVEAAEKLGMDIVEKDGSSVYFVEYGSSVTAEAIPGIHEGDRFLGTFNRAEGVANDVIDFFANGHALVEGLLAELEDSKRGRVTAVRLNAEQRRRLQGVYLLVVEGKNVSRTRMLGLLDASGLAAPLLQREGARVQELLTQAAALPSSQVSLMMNRFKEHPRVIALDPNELLFAALIVAMD
ncbi:MAG: helicase-related protein [bacterium]